MNNTENDKIKKYERLAVKKPKYYVSIGDLYSDDGDFKTATIYYQKAVDNGVLAYTVLGDTWGYRSQYKKAFDVYTEGANKGEAECFARLGFCYETGYVNNRVLRQSLRFGCRGSGKISRRFVLFQYAD